LEGANKTVRVQGRALALLLFLSLCSAALLAVPLPAGLPAAGQKVLAVAILAIGLWCSDIIPAAVTGLLVVIALTLTGAVPGLQEALVGFAEPVAYFLIGVLTLGLAVSKSGLAERVALFFLRQCRGSARTLYLQLLLSFPLLTLLLPSATTRTGILIHVYEQALELGGIPRGAPLAKAVMLALNSINRLASTILLTGGITPMLAASLIGGISWSRWLVLMAVPYGALLAVGAVLIYLLHRRGFAAALSCQPSPQRRPLSGREIRTLAIAMGASLLWLTDALHHWNPALPALAALACLLLPGIGVLTWRDFETGFGWANFFVLGASLSLARALSGSGASAWIAETIVRSMPEGSQAPLPVILLLLLIAAPVRLLIPNITGFLAMTIPLALSIGQAAGVNPTICGLSVMIAGDAVLYYPAQSASSLVVYERGHLTAAEILRFGLWMTLAGYLVVLFIALPYWSAIGEPLGLAPR
jgi:anion transporter